MDEESERNIEEMVQAESGEEEEESETIKEHIYAPKDFECGPWMDPSNVA